MCTKVLNEAQHSTPHQFTLTISKRPDFYIHPTNRPGVLIHLNLAGQRLGDESVAQLAPILASVRRVDLRHNNIGNAGAVAIAVAVNAAATAAAATTTTSATEERRTMAAKYSNAASTESKGCAPTKDPNNSQPRKVVTSIFVAESLSLAGNRIGDAGCDALRLEILENRRPDSVALVGAATTFRWLSVSGNPRISEAARERLLQAGTLCRQSEVTIVV